MYMYTDAHVPLRHLPIKLGLYFLRPLTPVNGRKRTRHSCLYFWRKRGPAQASVHGRKRAQTSAEFNHVELSRPA